MIKPFITIIASLILTSCASTYQYSKAADSPIDSSTASDQATICVIRTSAYAWGVNFNIYQDEKLIGKLGPKSYLKWNITPDGKEINIVSKFENKDIVTITPEPGKVYYLKQTPKMGIVTARTKLEIIDEVEGKYLMRKLKAPNLEYTKK